MSQDQKIFETGHLVKNIKKHSVRGGISTGLAQIINYVVQTGATIVLARLLVPEDFGLVGMAMTIVVLGNLFQELGLTQATVQKSVIKQGEASNIFWVNVVLGGLLCLCVFLLAPAVAGFYGEPRLIPICRSLSLVFFMGGMGVQHNALLRRQMRFGSIGGILVFSAIGGSAIGIVMAVMGFSYYSIVGMSLARAGLRTGGYWVACRWKPSFFSRKHDIRGMLKFGANLAGARLVNYFSRNLDYILIGKFHGSGPLGIYTKAYHLLLMPIAQVRTPIQDTALPALCALQSEPDRYRRYYRKIITILAYLSMPMVVVLCIASDNLVEVVLGSNWGRVSGIFRFLSIAAFCEPVLTAGRGVVVLSLGLGRRHLQANIVATLCTCTGIVCGLPWGVEGVALGFAIMRSLGLLLIVPWCLKGTFVSMKDFLGGILKPMVTSLGMAAAGMAVKQIFWGGISASSLSIMGNITAISVVAVTGIAAFFLVLACLPGGVGEFRGTVADFLMVRRKKKR